MDNIKKYQIINASQISREKWWEFTDNNENCNIFTTPYMYDVRNVTTEYKFFLLALLMMKIKKLK